ncbi:transmembrane amino acid transporter protein-domain-containing protein [Scenedesmus sp. NREL 46B-D3]|nr:transmembrane amino acid transporter protein-domain-containing protein [Scenedesmus sp. NREL 46B-D3]
MQDYTGGSFTPEVYQNDTFWPCTFNLSKVIMGAGMMAIPKAFNLLGLLPGLAIMALMACLTFFTLAGLVSATAATQAGGSYGALVRKTVGGAADRALQLAVLANCYVMNVVFVVVLADLLLGTAPEYAGLLPELLRMTGAAPAPAACWWLGRPFVLGVLSALVLLPLASMRSMEKLAVVNIIGVASNGLFAGLMLALAATAAAHGQLKPPQLLPDLSQLGSSPVLIAIALASIVPVLLNCNVCHQSLHPLLPLLKPYSVARMQRLVATALCVCNVLYFTVTICAGLVFGDALDADVLANITVAAMGPLIGPAAAVVMSFAVRVGYLLSIIGSYVLLCYPLRQCIGDLMLPGGQRAVQQHWTTLTALLVGTVFAIACYLPSIWGALALIGATASTVQAFIVPGLVILAVDRVESTKAATAAATAAAAAGAGRPDSTRVPLLHASGGGAVAGAAPGSAAAKLLRQATAVFVIVLGVGLFANSIVDNLWDYISPSVDDTARSPGLMAVYRQMLRPLL